MAKVRGLRPTNSSSSVANEPEWGAKFGPALFCYRKEQETLMSAVVIKEVFMEEVEPDLDLWNVSRLNRLIKKDGQPGKGNDIDKSRGADNRWHMLRAVAVRRLAELEKKARHSQK